MIQYNVQRDSIEYIDSRLRNTVVMDQGGDLVYVNRVGLFGEPNQTADVIYLHNGLHSIVNVETLNCSPLKSLGYSVLGNKSCFITRRPCRRYRQGFSWTSGQLIPFGPLPEGRWQSYKCLLVPHKKRYPRLTEALVMVQDMEWESVPITRFLSVNDRFQAMYRGGNDPVGVINADNGNLRLLEKYRYLTEVCEAELAGTGAIVYHA